VSKNKLTKFAEMLSFENVYQNFEYKNPQLIGVGHEEVELKGCWNTKHFQRDAPLVVELACGRGEYTVALARLQAEKNFIGVDVKGARIYKGAKIAQEEGLKNAAFLRTRIEVIEHFFEPGELDEIWITFPDPFLRKSKARRRLTSSFFLEKYRRLLKDGGIVHLKTDSQELFDFTQETAAALSWVEVEISNRDIYAGVLPMEELAIKTYYERMHLENGLDITYTRLRLAAMDVENDSSPVP